jgi:hypothetical protein
MLDISQILTQAFANLISGLIANIVWIVLFIWGLKLIGKELQTGIKNIPNWITQYDEIRMKHYQIEKARGLR